VFSWVTETRSYKSLTAHHCEKFHLIPFEEPFYNNTSELSHRISSNGNTFKYPLLDTYVQLLQRQKTRELRICQLFTDYYGTRQWCTATNKDDLLGHKSCISLSNDPDSTSLVEHTFTDAQSITQCDSFTTGVPDIRSSFGIALEYYSHPVGGSDDKVNSQGNDLAGVGTLFRTCTGERYATADEFTVDNSPTNTSTTDTTVTLASVMDIPFRTKTKTPAK
jgi:hypothetical protein